MVPVRSTVVSGSRGGWVKLLIPRSGGGDGRGGFAVRVAAFAAEFYSRLPEGVFREFVREPERREWAFTVERGGDLVFVRKRRWDEVEGFVELYHSVGRFEEPTRWEGLTGWDLVLDVDAELPEDAEGFLRELGELLRGVVRVCEELRRVVGLPAPDVINFSGSKGFHVRYFFESIRNRLRWGEHLGRGLDVEELVRGLGRGLVWLAEEGFIGGGVGELLDESMYELKRLIRCVGSLNAKSLLPAVPVWCKWEGSWREFRERVLDGSGLEVGCWVVRRVLTWPGGGLVEVLDRVLGLEVDVGVRGLEEFVGVWEEVQEALGEVKG